MRWALGMICGSLMLAGCGGAIGEACSDQPDAGTPCPAMESSELHQVPLGPAPPNGIKPGCPGCKPTSSVRDKRSMDDKP